MHALMQTIVTMFFFIDTMQNHRERNVDITHTFLLLLYGVKNQSN